MIGIAAFGADSKDMNLTHSADGGYEDVRSCVGGHCNLHRKRNLLLSVENSLSSA
ncbi:hypothetical protein DPMN_152883 [Dreissena polymorpha]|uniref:Uncharacterized protein n=1 Tax=Dreissena polymorpha TaxID=45954 RepID=A0A9D4FNU5_DREPO|nr:hypothetical protein DPMN_152883 [Dreissena polymorpha]